MQVDFVQAALKSDCFYVFLRNFPFGFAIQLEINAPLLNVFHSTMWNFQIVL